MATSPSLFTPHKSKPTVDPSKEVEQELFTAIHAATRRGNVAQIRSVLSHIDDEQVSDVLDSLDPKTGLTCLSEAVIRGHRDIVLYYLSLGANYNKIDSVGWTPLHWAIHQGFLEIACHLIKFGATTIINPPNCPAHIPTPYQLAVDQRFHLLDLYMSKYDVELAPQKATMLSIYHNAKQQNNPDMLNTVYTVISADLSEKDLALWNINVALRSEDDCITFANQCLKDHPLPMEFGTVDVDTENNQSDNDDEEAKHMASLFASDTDNDDDNDDDDGYVDDNGDDEESD